jgi:signal transduction histidine kinase
MRLLWQELRSRLQYKIVLPFALLALCVALAGSAIAFSLVANSWQERFDNQLGQATRIAGDKLVDQERANLQFLQEVAFAPQNDLVDAPAVAAAMAEGNAEGLLQALDPYFNVGVQRSGVRLDRLIAFNRAGATLVDMERLPAGSNTPYTTYASMDFSQTWFVPRVLNADSDQYGDKFAGIVQLKNTETAYFCTIAPVRLGDEIVGGLIVGMKVDSLLKSLQDQAHAAVLAIYDSEGRTLASTTRPDNGLTSLNINQSTMEKFWQDIAPNEHGIFDVKSINERDYQVSYTPLQIRNTTVGVLSVALSRDYVVRAWGDARIPLAVLTLAAMFAIIVLGIYIARLITAPLNELVLTTRSITAGNLHRRSQVQSKDEVGSLSNSFNHMTEHLIRLYGAVQAESNQRAAIVENITDGVVVCDADGKVLIVNRVLRTMLGLRDSDSLPAQMSDLPLIHLTEGMPDFDSRRTTELYKLNDYIVRVSIAPVITSGRAETHYVCAIQDLTSEIGIERARSNFIATISHELRTPLTVLRGNTDLLLRGLVGPLEDDQRMLIDSMRQHTTNMSALINNVIVLANLDSGQLQTNLEPLELTQVVEEAVWPLRSAIKAKDLELEIDIPDELPPVLGDMDQLRTVVQQLVDNAQRYTDSGSIHLGATREGQFVRVDIRDTGRGIAPHMHEQIFQRFIRGDGTNEGINSAQRGIGLGLAIVKQLVERHGGRVWVNSTPGQGSTFSFTLRYTNATGSPENSGTAFAEAA